MANVCPADPLLPADPNERDLQNAKAAVLRDLLMLQPFGLTQSQTAVVDELVAELAGV